MKLLSMDRQSHTLRNALVLLVALLVIMLSGCSVAPPAAQPGPESASREPPVRLWRSFGGGFLVPLDTAAGARPGLGIGAFVKLVAPTAVALRGSDLLIVDAASARIWRVDLYRNTLQAVPGPPATSGTLVALGPDLSAWVLDGASGQVLRYARSGQLLQTYRSGTQVLAPTAMALADSGATLLLADSQLRRWVEYRPVGVLATPVEPQAVDGGGAPGVDGLTTAGNTVYVLDRRAALVHVLRRDGRALGRLGEGVLKQPLAIAADRFGRVYVVQAQDRTITALSLSRPPLVLDEALVGVQVIGGIATDEQFLAVSDQVKGQVQIFLVRMPERQ